MEERSEESSERREGREIEEIYIYICRETEVVREARSTRPNRREHRKKKSPLKFPALN